MKRLVDVLFSAAGLVVLAPLLLLIALAIRLGSGGPVLFKQERVGRDFRPFRIYKFRTMVLGAERRGPLVTARDDWRITRFGRFLRGAKLDELPQLLNVLKGEMSLVGPRPEMARYVRLFQDDFREILKIRPGITDLASIAYRQESALLADVEDPEAHYIRAIIPDKIRLAKVYVERASVAYDILLLIETVFVLVYPAQAFDRLFDRLGQRHALVTAPVQAAAVALANLAAVFIRFDGAPSAENLDLAVRALPILVLIRCICLKPLNLYRDVWKYVGLPEAGSIVISAALGTGAFWALSRWAGIFPGYPGSVVALDGLLCVVALIGVRVARRLHWHLRDRATSTRRILVVGVDDSAERTVRALMSHPRCDYRVVGMVGEQQAVNGLRIHNVPIVGGLGDLERILRATDPDEILAIASALPVPRLQEAIRACRTYGRPVRIVPDLDDLLAGKTRSAVVEPPAADDLLFREPIQVDLERVREAIRGRRVMVTGAGGSIGSEICRQIAACAPARLVLFEKHEESLFHIERALRSARPDVPLDPVIGDVRDRLRVEGVFAATRAEIVFHAAAYKHVPMMELNPWEAVKTNLIGTRTVAEAANRAGVRTFVLISTDKAVEPVSVMGVSKRLAELTVQRLCEQACTRFLTVRFGNVLDSSGSVLPLFREQIERGGPVTVTHAEVTRWFMTVPEAVRLILTAATMGEGGEVFVLDMGRPVRILDLARALIRQHGLRPEVDVPIVFTGLRPGERLFEKLFNDHERVWKTAHPRILKAVDTNGNGDGRAWRAREFRRLLDLLRDKAAAGPAPEPRLVADGVEEEACA